MVLWYFKYSCKILVFALCFQQVGPGEEQVEPALYRGETESGAFFWPGGFGVEGVDDFDTDITAFEAGADGGHAGAGHLLGEHHVDVVSHGGPPLRRDGERQERDVPRPLDRERDLFKLGRRGSGFPHHVLNIRNGRQHLAQNSRT